MTNPETIEAFIERWGKAGGAERANYQLFLTELCDLIGVAKPEPAVEEIRRNAYVFERRVPARKIDGATTVNFIDLYKRGCFVLEAKQSAKRIKQIADVKQLDLAIPERHAGTGKRGGAGWDTMMRHAREQAEMYAKRLPADEGWPPFLVIVDVGHVIELFADFSLQGKHYAQFPDRQSFRIYLDDLRDEAVRERLRLVWTDPAILNPTRRTAEVTREVAELLARLSTSLETRLIRALPKNERPEALASARRAIAEKVALFLMRCLFTMFAEDIGLLPRGGFTDLLHGYRDQPDRIHFALEQLWRNMNQGGFSTDLHADVLKFNGGLFKNATALPITEDDLTLLVIAAERDWKDVEPAIFGTLLEHALDPRERHGLGAHYTPRAYVERLVVATIIEPLQEDWRNVQAAAAQLMESGWAEKARETVREFHRVLCNTRVLDPACGSGNFLYVAMELMKRLEGEILETLADLGDTQANLDLDRHTVDPHQFLGLEINPRAVAIAELVLWIGYLQWHFRTRGRTLPAEPVLKNFANIREQDAVIKYDKWDVLRDKTGRPITRWDGTTFKLHPITGEEVPDEAARTELKTYLNPRPADWPQAEFIVGNPPFIGGKDMRHELGDGYAEACWKARPKVPGGADFVMHFWDKAAETARLGKARRFGFITTNSITQKFSRRVVERHLTEKKPLSLLMAIPDHPWMKSADKAAVRIAMTVGAAGKRDGALRTVMAESGLNTDSPQVELWENRGKISADITIGAEVFSADGLNANKGMCLRGICLVGKNFMVHPDQFFKLTHGSDNKKLEIIKPYLNGKDLTQKNREIFVIDLYGMTEKDVQNKYPEIFQWLFDRVKSERSAKGGRTADAAEYASRWWQFAKPRPELRSAIRGLRRFIATPMTAKHRFFVFVDARVLPDQGLVIVGAEDALILGVLSSRIHVTWALAAGGTLEDRPRYNKTRCFDPFPFPDPPEALRMTIRDLAERLDAHRKDVLARHKQLTMTGLYNVLEKVRAGGGLTDAERDVYDAGLVGILRELHAELDEAVAQAYGWPADLPDEAILERVVALNRERAAEEAKGIIRWLRPEFQAPEAAVAEAKPEQIEAALVVAEGKAKRPRLPAALPDRVAAVRAVLETVDGAITAPDLARRFSQGRRAERQIDEVLRTLTLLGQAERTESGYVLAGSEG